MAHITESGRRKLYNEAHFGVGCGRNVVQKLSQSKLTMTSPKLTLIFRRVRGGDRGLAKEAMSTLILAGLSGVWLKLSLGGLPINARHSEALFFV
jgi:hypothetical protein